MSNKLENSGIMGTQLPCLCKSDGIFCGMKCAHREKVTYCGLSRLPEQRCVNMADLAKPSEWISVDGRLPEEGVHVQMYGPEIQHTGYYGGPNVSWVLNAPRLPRPSHKITHWQPLPSPPDKE